MLILPVVMGAVAEIWGVGPSFLVIGGLLLAMLGGIVIWPQRRQPGGL